MRFIRAIRRLFAMGIDLVLHFAHGALLVAGLVAVGLLAHTLILQGVDALRPAAEPLLAWTRSAPASFHLAADPAAQLSPRMRAVADYIARKYRISGAAAANLVAAAEDAASREGVDPMLVVAVMAVESGFNPIAESPMGAQGLMQVIPRWHQDKLEDMPAGLLDPATNIRVGARVLKSYIAQTESLTDALQVYCGAPADPAAGYANRVLEEKQRIEDVVRKVRGGVPA